MADTRIAALDEITTPDATDLLHIIDDVSGTPTNKSIRVSNLIGSIETIQTSAEIAAGVTPTNYQHEPGNVLRYGTNTTPGTTDMTTPILNMVAVAKQMTAPTIEIPDGTFHTTDTLVFDLPNDSTIIWKGTVTSTVSAKTSVQLGDTASQTQRLTVVGGIRLSRTTDDVGGTSVGVEIVRVQFWTIRIERSTGFGDGVLVSGVGGGNTHGHLHLGHIHDNTKNLRFTADASGFCNEHNIYGGSYSYTAAYSDFSNTVNITIDHNSSAKLNNITFYKPSLEGSNASTKAATIHGTNITIIQPRLERSVSQSTFEIDFTSNSLECCLIGKGFSIANTNITDSGANNIIITRNGTVESHQVVAPAANLPAASDPSCHRVKSTSSGSGLGYSVLDNNGTLRYSVDVSGKMYSNQHGYFQNAIRWATTDGTYTDRGLFRGTGSPEGVTSAATGSIYTNSSGGEGGTIYEKVSGSGNTGWRSLGRPIDTTTNLADVSNAINTSADKVEGYMVFNSVTNKPVWAAGSADADVWVDATGATAHTPV